MSEFLPARSMTNAARKRIEPSLHWRIAQIAERQHGVISIAQLHALGLTTAAVWSRVRRGQLHRIHRGVYAVGHRRLTREGLYMAAVLACGPDALLSHRSAAALRGLLQTSASMIDVTAPRQIARRPGLRPHLTEPFHPEDIAACSGVPCTSVARTLLDLAAVVPAEALEAAVREAEAQRVFDLRAIERVLERAGTRRGVRRLRDVLARYDATAARTRSELERRFLALCRTARLPEPNVNYWIPLDGSGVEADFCWPGVRLIAETDGDRVHQTRSAFVTDRKRDQRLARAGWTVVRFTWRQVAHEADDVALTLRMLLARAGRKGRYPPSNVEKSSA